MSDKAKTEEQGNEKHVRKTPEAVKNAGVISEHTHQDVHRQAIIVAQANDQHPSGIQPAVHENFGITGELTAKDKGKKHDHATAEQLKSISHDELMDKASKGDGFARDLDKQLHNAKTPGDRARVQDNADRLYHRGKYAEVTSDMQPAHGNTSDSAMHLKALAEHNAALEPVSKLREYADKLPESAQKKSLTALSREQAAELSPEMRARYDQQHEAGTHQALTNTPEGWLHAVQRIAQLPMDKQLEILSSALNAGIEQYNHDERERSLGRLIGTVEGAGQVATNLAKIADFSAYCIIGDHERASNMGKEFGDALGQTIVGGVGLWQAANLYLYNIGFAGDYAKPFRDIAELGHELNEHWSNLPPREQERIKSKFITEMIADGMIAVGGLSAVKKASSFTEILDAIAEEAKVLQSRGKKTATAIHDAVDALLQPQAVTPEGVKIRLPKDGATNETRMLMSKADGMGESLPKNCYRIEKFTGRLQRTNLGKLREPYKWKVMNEQFSPDVLRQSRADSCVSAVGEMLTKGRFSEAELSSKLGVPADVEDLPALLGAEWTSKKGPSTLGEIGKDGPWAAEMFESPWTDFLKPPHVVVVDGPSAAGNVMIRDPLEGTRYEMTVKDFLLAWTGRCAYVRK